MRLPETDPIAGALIAAIRKGDMEGLQRLLEEHGKLAAARLEGREGGSKTPLHAVADWPGFFPNGARMVGALIAAGADPNATVEGSWHQETPLHWTASSDDVDVADALIAGGADLEAPGASIAGGTPMDDAVGYGCWQVARLLVDRGAKIARLWHASALGVMSAVEGFFAVTPAPTQKEIDDAFWQACHGGQQRAAAYLQERGANIDWVPDYAKKPGLAIAREMGATRWGILADWLQKQGAKAG